MIGDSFFLRHKDIVFFGRSHFRRFPRQLPLDGGVGELVDLLLGNDGQIAGFQVLPEVQYRTGKKLNQRRLVIQVQSG